MDNSWLLEQDSSNLDSESDEEQKRQELESRLYSVLHHNDLSQPLPPSLAEQFSVECSDSGEVTVSLKKPLEDLPTGTDLFAKKNDGTVKDPDDEDVVFITESTPINRKENGPGETPVFHRKRFRYSDINIDEVNKLNGSVDSNVEGVTGFNSEEIDYFKPIKLGRFNKNKFGRIKLPTNATIPAFPQDWKWDSKHQFISVDNRYDPPVDVRVIRAIVKELQRENPNKGIRRLKEYASLLYKKNRKLHNKGNNGAVNKYESQNYNQTRSKMVHDKNDNFTTGTQSIQNSSGSGLYIDSSINFNKRDRSFDSTPKGISFAVDCESGNFQNEHPERKKQTRRKERLTPSTSGSISLNISSYKPNQSLILVSSGDEDPKSADANNIPPLHKAFVDKIPQKWTQGMVKYYTTPSKRKLNQSLEQIYDNFERTSGPDDWALDTQDLDGQYKSANRWASKCAKCGHRGHDSRKCEHKVRCYICAGFFHTAHNCPYLPCITCGVPNQKLGLNQECRGCYMSFMANEACRICFGHDHHTAICPDTWRSFHATVEGEKRVPYGVQVNARRWCCNCAQKGHFSHECTAPAYAKQPSPFVANYLAGGGPPGDGSVCITVPGECYEIINCGQADLFLQQLSNRTGALLEFGVHERESRIRVNGTFEQCNRVKGEVEEYVNTKKRAMRQPTFKNKRRKYR